ncbi:2-dehydropantoate 2-reductase [Lysinibacillus yapensis]|uniref:2-dehydropantoate 2-reductase n=1 Tax=Ureibacillus yapensis TaxID=2304605 RepID=A0A396SEP1_9BACL|nr:2-dehydropantoate 2-reductase [Lysinibacillus yapensis]RHW39745.1 2-dehydropantoate 2-reductase [Lysinibacillus yapensis]
MDIVVVGAGSVGMLIASYLAEANERVTLVVRRKEQAENLEKYGLVRKNIDGSLSKSRIRVAMNLENISKDTLVIIAVKYGQLKEIYKQLQTLHVETPLLFLQNGLAHFDEASMLPQRTIAFGSCQFGAQRENNVTVIHRGQGVLKIAVEKGDSKQPFSIFSKSSNELFQVFFENNAEKMLFEKALLNCFVNPLTAILKVKNGMLIENPQSLLLLENLYKELKAAFPEEMTSVKFEDVKNLCRNTAENTSSMLGDFLYGRPTEIETIVGAVLKRARKKGKQCPTLQTLYSLILIMEGSGEMM